MEQDNRFSVKITGFETEQQAIDWCEWYEGEGEQNVYLGDTDLSANTDMDKYRELYSETGLKVNDNGEIELPIQILGDDG